MQNEIACNKACGKTAKVVTNAAVCDATMLNSSNMAWSIKIKFLGPIFYGKLLNSCGNLPAWRLNYPPVAQIIFLSLA